MNNNTRVVVTGMGAVTPIGNDVETFWEGLKAGKKGFGPITYFDTSDFKSKIAAQVKDFNAKEYMDPKAARRMETFSQYAVAAASQALAQSGIDMAQEDPYKVGISIGSGIGSLQAIEREYTKMKDKGPGRVNPLLVPLMISNMATGNVSIQFGLKGKSINVVTACATGTHSIGEAFRAIQHGEADVMVAGGAEACITPLGVAGFTALTALSGNEDPETELVGYGATSDAYHITSPAEDGSGAAKAMEFAMNDAGIVPEQIDYVNAHGTSTHHNDLFETMAIKLALGEHAYKVKINSTKSMIGHLLGAAGGVEFITCVKSVMNDFVHATVGLKEPGEGCDLDYTMGEGVSTPVNYAASNSLGFGGHNATLIVKKFEA